MCYVCDVVHAFVVLEFFNRFYLIDFIFIYSLDLEFKQNRYYLYILKFLISDIITIIYWGEPNTDLHSGQH